MLKAPKGVFCYHEFMSANQDKAFFDPAKPRKHVIDALQYVNGHNALDMGASIGNNTQLLLENDYHVVAVEPRDKNVAELNHLACGQLQVVQSSIEDYESSDSLDLVICTMVLHFLEPQDIGSAIAKLQRLTKVGGINVISAYTNDNDTLSSGYKYFFKPNELRHYYDGWEMLDYIEGPSALPSPKDNKRRISARLTARRAI
jgi:tellurite methyltransferase